MRERKRENIDCKGEYKIYRGRLRERWEYRETLTRGLLRV